MVPRIQAQDFADPSSILEARAAKPIEIEGKIQSTTTNKPGWYAVILDLGNGKALKVFVTPGTKFWGSDPAKPKGSPYIAVTSDKALPKIAAGQKVRALHKLDTDVALHLIWISDLLFVEK